MADVPEPLLPSIGTLEVVGSTQGSELSPDLPFLAMDLHSSFLHLLFFFSCCSDKNTLKKQFKGKKVYLACSSKLQSITLKVSREQ